MRHVVPLALAVLTLAYGGLVVALMVGLGHVRRRRRDPAPPAPDGLPTVSVIVAARNEAHHLPRLLQCLYAQDYPPDRLQLCVVDDRSEDGSWALLEAARRAHPDLLVHRVADRLPDFAPKKRALDHAIRASRGDILLLTDADCAPPPTWVRAIVACYGPDTALVLGYAPFQDARPTPGLIGAALRLDLLALGAVAAGSTGLGRPVTATGCNLSYRRSTYLAVGGFEPIRRWPSGDDDLFVLLVGALRPGALVYALRPDTFVPQAPPASWTAFWHQRLRWASKGLHYPPFMRAVLGIVYALNALIVLGALAAVAGEAATAAAAGTAWGAKSALDLTLLRQAARAFHQPLTLGAFLVAGLLHPVYVVVFGALGVIRPYRWKGEVHGPR